MAEFTRKYLPLVSDYSQILRARKDSQVSIYHLQVITHEYKSKQQELLVSIFYFSVISCEQYIPHVA